MVQCCCQKKQQPPPQRRGHHRRSTTMHEVLLSVGCKYAFCRQFIFLTNALLIGCGMALIAAGWQKSDNNLSIWLGDSWYQTQISLGGSILITTLLGCLGSCYQSRIALTLV